MNFSLAPILLFVYNRPWHTEQTLEALMDNELADQSILYIYCDGPKANASVEILKSIKEVRAVIRKKNWCKKVIIIERDENLGLANSVIKGVTEVIKRHGKVIVLEDDILTGKYFLKFMNDGLEIYKGSEKVFGVSGYKYPSTASIKESTYFLPISSSWSFGTWLNRWSKVNFNGNELLRLIDDRKLAIKVDFGSNSFYKMLKDQISGANDSWAIRYYISMFLENSFFLYPNKSLIENIGFDNSGTHCGPDNYYSTSVITQEEIKIEKLETVLNKSAVKKIRKSFIENFDKRTSKKPKIQQIIKRILRRLKLSSVAL